MTSELVGSVPNDFLKIINKKRYNNLINEGSSLNLFSEFSNKFWNCC
jgi:hypothetical protein